MSVRPGTPITVTDEYLAAILAELRSINAKLGQATTVQTTIDWPDVMGSEEVQATREEMLHPGRGVIV